MAVGIERGIGRMTARQDRSVTAQQDRPTSVILLIAALVCVAVGATVVDAMLFGLRGGGIASLPVLGVVLCAAALFQIRFRYRDETEALDLFEAALIPVVFAYSGLVVVSLVVLANVFEGTLRRNAPLKGAFNVAQWAAAAGVGSLVYSALRTGGALDGHNIAALAGAMIVVLVVNHVAFTAVVAIAHTDSLESAVAGLRAVIVPGWLIGGGLNLAFGFLFVAAYTSSPAFTALFIVPLGTLHWASAAFAAARADEVRLEGLHRASALLGGRVDPLDAMDEFLEEVRCCFEAEAAELVLRSGDTYTARCVPTESTPLPGTLVTSLLSLSEPARLEAQSRATEGWRDCLAAPLIDGGEHVGVLCTYNRTGLEGFEDGELAVLSALAADVVAALQRGALVERVVDERRKLRDIVGRASDGIFSVAADGAVTSWNAAMEEITRQSADDIVGRVSLGLLRPRDTDGRDVLFEHWARSDTSLPAELQILTKAGELRWLSCSYSRPEAPEAALIVIARDVTKVRDVERLREDFVATVSHELRTPLSPIKGWASTLLEFGDRLDPEERRAGMLSILRQAQRLERLVVNLLEVSKIEHGLHEVSDSDVAVSAVVRRIISDFEAESPERPFVVQGDDTCLARARELWLEQVLTNLVSNAVKYSPDTEPVEVRVWTRGDRVNVVVSDRGCGIPAHELDRIFERFHRVRESTTQTGTGLGLFIARQLAEQMDGTITVDSSPGEGSRFVVSLPAAARIVDVRSVSPALRADAG